MRSELLDVLVCAQCGGDLAAEGVNVAGELHDGTLRCDGCGAVLPVTSGVPRAVGGDSAQAKVARAFSLQWDAYDRGEFERRTVYGRSDANLWEFFLSGTGISESALVDLAVLDAGCGPASISRPIAQHGARTVVALDISDAVDAVAADARNLTNLHAIQADLMAAPLRAAFDLVWSAGVIHHTNDAAEAFRSLTRYVRPGGLLFVWVYPRDLRPFHWSNTTQWIQAILARVGLRRLSDSTILRLADILSYPTVGLHMLYRAARSLPGLRPRTLNARESVTPITRRAFHLIWNDALVPPFTSWHREREVVGWFREAGFTDIVIAPTRRLGVRGRAPVG
ncbi:MAG TPA: methyltransferase domain-containing protein [Solirubrobacteraceae bacterium]|jgi:SAM-dependent methyltransferase/uncharacterized protein YbaR (Trm112 family)|nr:methyltransferase domain-containing protein [Solirubrobacteraceae bacterium]